MRNDVSRLSKSLREIQKQQVNSDKLDSPGTKKRRLRESYNISKFENASDRSEKSLKETRQNVEGTIDKQINKSDKFCSACNDKFSGLMIKCSNSNCNRFYHASCSKEFRCSGTEQQFLCKLCK